MSSMMVLMLVAGIGLVLAGLAVIGYGIPVKEFSVGSTLILTGTIIACTGIILLGFWMALRELQNMAQRLSRGMLARPGAAAAPGILAGSRTDAFGENGSNQGQL